MSQMQLSEDAFRNLVKTKKSGARRVPPIGPTRVQARLVTSLTDYRRQHYVVECPKEGCGGIILLHLIWTQRSVHVVPCLHYRVSMNDGPYNRIAIFWDDEWVNNRFSGKGNTGR